MIFPPYLYKPCSIISCNWCCYVDYFFILYCIDDCFAHITQTTVQFAKSLATLANDLLRLYTVELEGLIAAALTTILTAQLTQFQTALKADKFKEEVS